MRTQAGARDEGLGRWPRVAAFAMACVLGLGILVLPALLACGPFFPNTLLLAGDDAVLQAPEVDFRAELDRLQLEPPPGLVHVERKGDDSERASTLAAEIADLRRALGQRGLGTNEAAEVVLSFSRMRADLEDHRRALERWRDQADAETAEPAPEGAKTGARPELVWGESSAGIPREFDLYLRGALAWHEGRTNEARSAWSAILALPAAERAFKSTWAAFMLGRSWHESEPAVATRHYEQSRRLARAGLSDSAGLAVASLGWEGQLKLRTNDLSGALRLYLDQYAAGSKDSAGLSLRVAAQRVVEADAELRIKVARDSVARRVVTAWMLASSSASAGGVADGNAPVLVQLRAWLETLESVGAAEVPLAEQLCLLTYRAGDWEAAERWIGLSGDSVVAQWVKAKLLLREGKVSESAAAYAQVVSQLPLERPVHEPDSRGGKTSPGEFVDSLSDGAENVSARRRVLGEWGVLRLTQGEFVQALDALLRSGYWEDAAYVAERVLTASELKVYVDGHWPVASGNRAKEEALQEDSASTMRGQRERIRYLLARRLTRSNRGREATDYFPAAWRDSQKTFLALLAKGEDTNAPARDRAQGWFAAAWMARTNGMELMGTELAPDWTLWSGEYEGSLTHEERAKADARRLQPTHAELKRASEHSADPDERFHYRYQAAFLAWDAARMMPNNDPETALMLYWGGSWLKTRDPKTADLFYKALVRRCRATELGDAADRQRWFPPLDATGKPMVTRRPKVASPADERPKEVGEPDDAVPAPDPMEPEPVEAPLIPGAADGDRAGGVERGAGTAVLVLATGSTRTQG